CRLRFICGFEPALGGGSISPERVFKPDRLQTRREWRTFPDMSLDQKLTEEIKVAMKSKDTLARDTLRMIKSALGQAEIAKGSALDDAEEIAVLLKAVKTRNESADQYDQAGRAELAEKERAEIVVIQRFLPQPLSDEEAEEAVRKLAEANGFDSKKQMGALMKLVKSEYSGRIDGKLAAKIAQKVLS
ncbi:MAG: GatB/YqeY domain-containing protein, partial [Myxococcota bacterium]